MGIDGSRRLEIVRSVFTMADVQEKTAKRVQLDDHKLLLLPDFVDELKRDDPQKREDGVFVASTTLPHRLTLTLSCKFTRTKHSNCRFLKI